MSLPLKSTFALGLAVAAFFTFSGSLLDSVKTSEKTPEKASDEILEVGIPNIYTKPSSPLSPQVEYSKDFYLNHKVRKGESFTSLFSEYGIDEKSQEVVSALTEKEKELSLKKGEHIELALNDKGKLHKLLLPLEENSFMLLEKEGSEFSTSNITYTKEDKERIAVGSIQTSFAQAADRAGLSYRVVDELVDLFAGRFSFQKDFRKDDRFVVIFRDSIREDGKSLGYTKVLAAMVSVKGKNYVAVRYVGKDGKERYFDEEGDLIGEAFLRYPLKFSRISSKYSLSRLHPVLKRRRPHLGVDFAAPKGTPVRSVADGQIIKAGRSGGAGIMLKVKHSGKYSTAYLHLSRIAKGIRKSKNVKRGQIIGYVGSTGLSTGPHLDFRFYKNGKSVNPLTVKLPKIDHLDSKTKVKKRFLKRVLFTLEHYHKVDLKDFYVG